ncbi:MAG: EamA family transporter RarD [Caldilineales bacterium]
MKKGPVLAALSYLMWGFFPIYWHRLSHVGAVEILLHRIIWSFIVVVVMLLFRRRWEWLRDNLRHPARLRVFVFTALLLAVNWLVYIWANNNGHIVEASLGYFINPLVNVVLGMVVLHEHMRRGQLIAIGIAAAGVLFLLLVAGGWLWISFALAFSFGIYGLLRKTARLGSLEGLSVEMAVLTLPALAGMLFLFREGQVVFGATDAVSNTLLAFSGVVTAVPLLLFAAGARQVPLSTLGLLQYIAPTLQFSIGVLLYHEPFDHLRLIGFGLVWLALLLYWLESYRYTRPSPLPLKT